MLLTRVGAHDLHVLEGLGHLVEQVLTDGSFEDAGEDFLVLGNGFEFGAEGDGLGDDLAVAGGDGGEERLSALDGVGEVRLLGEGADCAPKAGDELPVVGITGLSSRPLWPPEPPYWFRIISA